MQAGIFYNFSKPPNTFHNVLKQVLDSKVSYNYVQIIKSLSHCTIL